MDGGGRVIWRRAGGSGGSGGGPRPEDHLDASASQSRHVVRPYAVRHGGAVRLLGAGEFACTLARACHATHPSPTPRSPPHHPLQTPLFTAGLCAALVGVVPDSYQRGRWLERRGLGGGVGPVVAVAAQTLAVDPPRGFSARRRQFGAPVRKSQTYLTRKTYRGASPTGEPQPLNLVTF